MPDIKEKLLDLQKKATDFGESAKKVTETCYSLGKAWSGSSFVGHAKYFFGDFEEPTVPQRFSIEWGLIYGVPNGWIERSDEEIRSKIEADSGVQLDILKNFAIELGNEFQDIQRETVLTLAENGHSETELEKLEKFSIRSATDIFNDIFPTKFMTRDTNSTSGYYIAPHIYYDAVARYVSNFPGELKGFIFELEKLIRKKVVPRIVGDFDEKKSYYVENSIIVGLAELKSEHFDLSKLIKMCKELNDNFSLGNYLSCGMLIRSILDHIPPIFDKKTFEEVTNHYGTKSFKDIILPLEKSARKISDSYLHNTIQKKELLPNKTQISFQPNMDVLLSEIIRILSV